MKKESETHIAIFNGKAIRRIWYAERWWFVIEDIIVTLTDSVNPKDYISKMKQRDKPLEEGWGQIVRTLPIQTGGGKQLMNCADTEGIFRIIQSIPSKKAEPFKRWLARVGYERIQEIENPELAQERMKKLYELKGYSKDWIDKRLRGISVRQDLTDEWKNRGIEEEKDFAILTAEISKATFGMSPTEYKKFKGLKNENLRDHMTDLELIFSMLGEASTTEIERVQNPNTFDEHLEVSNKGGNIAKNARIELEQETGESVVSDDNFLDVPEKFKKKKRKLIYSEVENEK
ncbi:MAG: phage antirepressor protein [Nanoarchaeota archaeon]|nr:phage antirepressor protein [Nanoarchaeota archaeon]